MEKVGERYEVRSYFPCSCTSFTLRDLFPYLIIHVLQSLAVMVCDRVRGLPSDIN